MISAIIPAGGIGKRIGFKKQYYILNHKPILAHTLDIFQKNTLIDEIILVCPGNDINYCKKKIVEKFRFTKVKKIVAGGKTRQASVTNGLKQSSNNADYILIHDAVRPFFNKELLPKLISEVKKHKAVVTALPSKDTVKILSDRKIIETLPRDRIFLAQTPQIFAGQLIRKAYKKANRENFTGTDDSSLVERLGEKVKIFIGNEENIKITTKKDLKSVMRLFSE